MTTHTEPTRRMSATLPPASCQPCALVLAGAQTSAGMQGFPLAINLNANLAGNSHEGTFIARAGYVKRGRSVSIVRTTVTDRAGKLIADVTTSHVASK